MTTPVWPAALPQAFIGDSFSEALPDNVIRDQFDVGPASVRRRTTAQPYEVGGSMQMTTAQWETFKTFCRDTLLSRSLPFVFPEQGCPETTVAKESILLDRTLGTNIGDLTGGGGLAAAFDGVTNQALSACASKAATTFSFVGKRLPLARTIQKLVAYGSNNAGYVNAINPTVALALYGKNGVAPTGFTDGTQYGAGVAFTDTANESVGRSIPAGTPTPKVEYVWLAAFHAGAVNTIAVAELEIYAAAWLARFTAPPTRARMGAGKWLVNVRLEILP